MHGVIVQVKYINNISCLFILFCADSQTMPTKCNRLLRLLEQIFRYYCKNYLYLSLIPIHSAGIYSFVPCVINVIVRIISRAIHTIQSKSIAIGLPETNIRIETNG